MITKGEQKPSLPPLRKGLTFAFSDYDPDGKPQWLIHDAARNKFFVIGWTEFELLKRWDLNDPALLLQTVNSETTLHAEAADLEALVRFLEHNFLTAQNAKQIFARAREQKLFKNENILHWLISYYLFFRIPLVHPDKFLVRTRVVGDILFSPYMAYFMLILAGLGLYQLSMQWETFTHTFPTIFTLQGLLFYFIAFSICKLFHELGHAYRCRSYGIPVPTLGLAFLVFWPVLYTDTTLSWQLNSKKRMRIALAGIWIETYVTIIALLIWCNTTNVTLQTIAYVTITVNWMASLLINVSPFMRFDGYYVLSDFCKMPNLQIRAFALTRWQIRRILFGWQDPPPEKFSLRMHWFLIAYSIGTWLYRLLLYFGIAILVYHFFFKLLGIILFGIEMFYFILGPFLREILFWYGHRELFAFNLNARITLYCFIIAIVLFFVPLANTLDLPATMSYQHQFLYAPEAGVITQALPEVGTHVTAHQILAKIDSSDLDYALQKVRLEYKKTVSELRRAAINTNFSSQQTVLESDLDKQRALNIQLLEEADKLNIKVPFNGVILDKAENVIPGVVVQKDEWLGDVVQTHVTQVEAYVSQRDLSILQAGLTGYFYPDGSNVSIPVQVITIEPLNSAQLSCQFSSAIAQNKNQDIVVETPCYNANELGGEIPTFLTEEGDYVPVNSVYRVLLTTDKPVALAYLERGTASIKTQPHSYAYRFFYFVKTVLLEESGF